MVFRFSSDLMGVANIPAGERKPGRLPIGAPSVYLQPEVPKQTISSSRMDVCAFVGVAPRGPARVPELDETWQFDRPCVEPTRPKRRSTAVPVESFAEYRRLYSGFEGPGRLPYVVAAFFEQGGSRAYIVRIVHDYGSGDPGNGLRVAQGAVVTGATMPLHVVTHQANELFFEVADKNHLSVGTLLRVTMTDGQTVTRLVESVDEQIPSGGVLAIPHVTFRLELPGVPSAVEAIDGFLLTARNEGSWGNKIRADLGFTASPIDIDLDHVDLNGFRLDEMQPLPIGSLLRITLENGIQVFRFLHQLQKQFDEESSAQFWTATFDTPLSDVPTLVEVVEGSMAIDDGAGQTEFHQRLGLSRMHPRWAATVLCYESELVFPHASWAEGQILPGDAARLSDPVLNGSMLGQFADGHERYAEIVPSDFFDDFWGSGDPDAGDGVQALTRLADLSTVVVPDLYSHEPLAPTDSVVESPPRVGATFERCVDTDPPAEIQESVANDLEGLLRDPKIPSDLNKIIGLQKKLVALAEQLQQFVVLLDVPPGLTTARIQKWRGAFQSSYAAAYHPWIQVSRTDDERDRLIWINPAGFAAGIMAHQEHLFGVPHGPANVIAVGALDVEQVISPRQHDVLHPQGINVFLSERDGIRLTAGRTLSRNPRYRQLTVRRLMIMLRRVLQQQMHWMVFEPNGPSLWADVRYMLRSYLRQLFQAGAFRGATEAEAFFVRCDAELNPPSVLDAGKMIAEIGIAPSEPLEFILVQLIRQGEGFLTVEM